MTTGQNSAPSNDPLPDAMSQSRTYPVESIDLERLQRQRHEITRFISAEDKANTFATAMGKLTTIKIVLETGVFNAKHTRELQCLGVIFGDIFVQQHNFRWVMVSDQQGVTPAIAHESDQLTFFPLTMISKRIESGEKVDITQLYRQLSDKVQTLITGNAEVCEI